MQADHTLTTSRAPAVVTEATPSAPTRIAALFAEWRAAADAASAPDISDAACADLTDRAGAVLRRLARSRATGPADVLLKIQAWEHETIPGGSKIGGALIRSVKADLARLAAVAVAVVGRLDRDPARPERLSLIYPNGTATRFAIDQTRDDVAAVLAGQGLVLAPDGRTVLRAAE